MPKYEFKCQKCSHMITLICLMSELDNQQPKSCPKCRSRKVSQVLNPPIALIPHTLGSLAESNTRKMSDDERHYKTEQFNAYKKAPPSWVSTDDGIIHTKQPKRRKNG